MKFHLGSLIRPLHLLPMLYFSGSGTAVCDDTNAAPQDSYDFIVVGSGAAGIPVADRLSEAGKKVLLIEQGPPSSGRWLPKEDLRDDVLPFDNWRPGWLNGTNLTRFDVPGLNQRIWKDSEHISCSDMTSEISGCVLGGGMAINSALWWKAPHADWDYNYPDGWKAKDMEQAVNRVFERMPWTDAPSTDGIRYRPEGYNLLSKALTAAGWKNVTANEVPNEKNRTFSHANFYYSHGERNGPFATYLATASQRPNFTLWMNTEVRRVLRNGSTITGVEISTTGSGGRCGTIPVSPSGKAILSGGYFGTPKILFRSGIGPEPQLRTVQTSEEDGPTFISEEHWLRLPVGQGLRDHTATNLEITHPSIEYYDFQVKAWEDPVPADVQAYLANRTGILTTSAPNTGPMIWDVVDAPDGPRQIQWTCRVAGNTTNSMTLAQYLGRGSTSVGEVSINANLTTSISVVPHVRTREDRDAIVQGIKNLIEALSVDPEIKFTAPAPGVSVEEFVDTFPVTIEKRRGIHYMGTAKMGTDSGLLPGGTAVVDLDTKVYGMDNLFVVDASIMPGMVTGNPSAMILAVAEKAVERILARGELSGGNAADQYKEGFLARCKGGCAVVVEGHRV